MAPPPDVLLNSNGAANLSLHLVPIGWFELLRVASFDDKGGGIGCVVEETRLYWPQLATGHLFVYLKSILSSHLVSSKKNKYKTWL